MGKKFWRETFGVRSEAKYSFLVKIFYSDPSGTMCRSGTLQSVIYALWLQSATPALWIRFGTLRQWCVKFLPGIFYLFWAPHSRKLRIGLFDCHATKWCF